MSKLVYGVLVIGLCVLAASHNTSHVYADGIISSTDNGVADAQGGVGNVLADSDAAEGDADEIEKKTQKLILEEKLGYDKAIERIGIAIEVVKESIDEKERKVAELKKEETPEDVVKDLGGPKRKDFDSYDEWLKEALLWLVENAPGAADRWNKAVATSDELIDLEEELEHLPPSQDSLVEKKNKEMREKEAHCIKHPVVKQDNDEN